MKTVNEISEEIIATTLGIQNDFRNYQNIF